jgi:hypothetical protein
MSEPYFAKETEDSYIGRIKKNMGKPQHRVMVGIPMTGLLRSEWVFARYGQVIPCNWSQVETHHNIDQYSPLDYTVADARNLIATAAVEQNFEWLFFIDHDVVLPQGTILKLNERILKKDVPVVSGLYFTKSYPAEPLIYRGRGNSYYKDWELGDEVWVDAIPMGCALINVSLLKAMYDESEVYEVSGLQIRKIFETPAKFYFDAQSNRMNAMTGTEDIAWCTRVVKDGIFEKAGWKEYAKKKYPFLIDTSIFCRHIDWNGKQYPSKGEEWAYLPKDIIKTQRIKYIERLKDRFNMRSKEELEVL